MSVPAEAITAALVLAAEAEFTGDTPEYLTCISDAAAMLADLYVGHPVATVGVIEEVRRRGVEVRPCDLDAAVDWAAERIEDLTGTRPVLLHVDALDWIAAAIDRHPDADPTRVAVVLACRIEVGATVELRRPGLPWTDELVDAAEACTIHDIRAAIDVLGSHDLAMKAVGERLQELADLLVSALDGDCRRLDGLTLPESIDLLDGDARTRAEELFSALPMVWRWQR